MVKEITHEILYLPGRIEAPHFFRISTLDATRLNKELDYTSLPYYLGLPLRCKLRYLHGSPALPRIPIVHRHRPKISKQASTWVRMAPSIWTTTRVRAAAATEVRTATTLMMPASGCHAVAVARRPLTLRARPTSSHGGPIAGCYRLPEQASSAGS